MGIAAFEQVGAATFDGVSHAGRWAGTAESWVDLHPAAAASSLATCTTGTMQGGWVTLEHGSGPSTHASLWNGTASSWVDLNPDGSTVSAVRGIFGDQQVGYADFQHGVRASLWTGAAKTWLDLTPPGAHAAELNGVFADQQVGWATFADGHARAGLWTGTATSWIDLSAVLPAEFEQSWAYGIWSDGATTRIVGSGINTLTGTEEALLWSIPAPGVLSALGPLGLVAMRRARRNRAASPRDPAAVAAPAVHVRPNAGSVVSSRVRRAAIFGLALVGTGRFAHAQWTVAFLHPAGATHSGANAIGGSQQVGVAFHEDGSPRASLWTGSSGSWVDLHPSEFARSDARAVGGGQQAGVVYSEDGSYHASLWSGTATSWVDLHPDGWATSIASGVANGQQVGYVYAGDDGPFHASLWSGTAESWVDLNPAGSWSSVALAVGDGQQAGYVQLGRGGHASLWTGKADSWIDLHPSISQFSYVSGVAGGRQAGAVIIGGDSHASLWSGTAASWIDLHPPEASQSIANAIWGQWQAGSVVVAEYGRAALWNGTAASWEDLSAVLPGQWDDAAATGIWSDDATLYVTGVGSNPATDRTEAILWSRPIPAPGATGLLTVVGLGAASRRRRPRGVLDARPAARHPHRVIANCDENTAGSIGCTGSNFLLSARANGLLAAHRTRSVANGPFFGMLAGVFMLAFTSGPAWAQWSVTNLHPPGDWYASSASGVSALRQVGSVEPDGGIIGAIPRYASLWSGTAGSWVSLHPDDDFWTQSEALGIADHQQVGHVIHVNSGGPPVSYQRACIWNDTAVSLVFLADAPSSAVATSGTNQVGWVFTGGSGAHASLWSGTAESRVDLHPSGALFSIARAVHGVQQVGSVDDHACLWRGTAESWLDLHPVGATSSIVVGTTDTGQVGDAVVSGQRHASLWSGTAASWVDLNPAGATESSASAIFGDWKVGYASFSDGPHAGLWHGTAESWEDLSSPLGGSWTETYATGIWSDGSTLSITGYGFNMDTERAEALLWTRPIPSPGAAALLVLGGLIAGRCRRQVGGPMK